MTDQTAFREVDPPWSRAQAGRRRASLFAAAVAALALAGCPSDDGPRTTQARDLADFTRIDNRDSVDVRLHVGEPQRLRQAQPRRLDKQEKPAGPTVARFIEAHRARTAPLDGCGRLG